ncbi:hypothetical protein [Bradyrhizobium sp. AS23.2]|uniref:hypothetical protein n=1 Tax=Bradyrhizobium sp. AS23.2 TaxID=1680155 RepID=UPI00093C8981|nr:hypothetical protein [Bradyrhizobium sp. AS23.2]OKO80407.1 hypothetical protein AC630_15730 [Bradyrhizobium sp. AS23.2]
MVLFRPHVRAFIAASLGSACLPLLLTDHALAEDTIQLEQMLSADEQAQLGISTMPLAKRDAMRGALIRMYQQGYRAAKGADRLSAGSGTGVIETQVDEDFNGWEGETVVKLLNGQIWQQTEYHYEYHYAYMPKVLVYAAGAGYKMKVDGVSKAIGVQRLR